MRRASSINQITEPPQAPASWGRSPGAESPSGLVLGLEGETCLMLPASKQSACLGEARCLINGNGMGQGVCLIAAVPAQNLSQPARPAA